MRRILLFLLAAGGAFGQTVVAPSGFEVASIKLNDSGDRGSSQNGTKGELLVRNSSLKGLIQGAYNVREYSFTGPDWLNDVRFDVTAKYPPEQDGLSREDRQILRRGMMQKLLAERFHLVAHFESKMLPGYALVVGKKGLKITASAPTGGTSISTNNGKLTGTGMTMANLANTLGNALRSPVDDQTGLKGEYKIELEWSVDEGKAGGDGGEVKGAADTRPSLFTAVQETLGLRLESKKVPVQILVVDRVERTPTEN